MINLYLDTINWLTIPVGAVLYMFVGGLWYGPIAGKAWMEVMGLTEEDMKDMANPTGAMIKSFISAIVMSFGLAWLMASPAFVNTGALGGAIAGVVIAILIVGGATFPNYAFENKRFKHFLIHMGSVIVAMALIGAMMAIWR